MRKNNLKFSILDAAKELQINGLSITNISLENGFLYNSDITGFDTVQRDERNRILKISLKGLVLQSLAYSTLQKMAFDKSSINIDISNQRFNINGLFQIQRYVIEVDVNHLDCFSVDLISKNKFQYNTIDESRYVSSK